VLEWAAPLWLLLLPVALLAPWLSRGPRVRFSSIVAVRARPTARTLLAWLVPLLASLALTLFVVGLARPQLVDRERVVEREGIDILLVLDTSGSMEAEDFTLGGRTASRLSVAKEVVAQFIEGRPDDRIALVDFLRQVEIGMAGSRQTAIGDAIAVGGRRLKELEAESRIMILLTDGRSNAGKVEPLDAAEAARSLGLRIYTVGVGAKGRRGLMGLFPGRTNDLDEKTLRAIALKTEGQYFRATDTRGLQQVYATIDQLEKSTAESREFVHREEIYQAWVWSGLGMLLLHLLLAETVLRRLP